MEVFIEGLALQASLILALGSQNLFIIEMGIKRQHQWLIASICSVCDFILIMLGILGVSALLQSFGQLKALIGFAGLGFLLYYAVLKLKEAFRGGNLFGRGSEEVISQRKAILMTLSFTLLNPHVYIDTFFLIGGYSSKFDSLFSKILFGLGASAFSVIWFFCLSGFTARFSGLLMRGAFARGLAFASGVVLTYLAFKLGRESLSALG